jgi:hypothetical protein
MMNDDDPETAMQRFEDLLGRLVSVTTEEVQKAERAAEEIVEEALGPPPSGAPALDDEAD